MSCKTILEALSKCSPCCADDEQKQPQPKIEREMGLGEEPVPTFNSYAEAFSYNNLMETHLFEFRDYQAVRDNQFIKVSHKDADPKAPRVGWKIHVSLDDSDINNVAAGWNIVKKHLIDNNIGYFKVVTSNVRKDNAIRESEIGRQIAIYATGDPSVYSNLLQLITKDLVEHGVRPGFSPILDR